MNNLENILILKYGGIHIKPENKGKFTEYCGGKVTQECIQRGKHSSNPTTRKRATFAANARKWKHKNGGNIMMPDIIKFFNGGETPLFQNSGKIIDWKNKTGYMEDPYTNRVGSTSQYSYGDVQKDENGFTYRDSRLQFNTPTGEVVETNYVRKYKPNRRYNRYVKKYGKPVEPHVWINHNSDGTTSTDTLGYTPEQIDSLNTYFNTFGGL